MAGEKAGEKGEKEKGKIATICQSRFNFLRQ